MKPQRNFLILYILILGLVSACDLASQMLASTPTPAPTATLTPTPTFTPSPTDTPTITPTYTPMTQVFNVIVPANAFWVDTGIRLVKGQTISIRASGTVNTMNGRSGSNSDPAGQTKFICDDSRCPLPSAHYGELIGRIGVLKPFSVGSKLEMKVPVKGTLILTINDWSFDDNRGEFSVIITVR